MTFDYKNVDWKQIKKEWNQSPVWFELSIQHGENKLTFHAFLDKNKKCKLGIYINGWFKGEYMNSGSPYQKYLNRKELKPFKEVIDFHKKSNRKYRKKTAAEIAKAEGLKSYPYVTFSFDNIDQIKKMVTSLE